MPVKTPLDRVVVFWIPIYLIYRKSWAHGNSPGSQTSGGDNFNNICVYYDQYGHDLFIACHFHIFLWISLKSNIFNLEIFCIHFIPILASSIHVLYDLDIILLSIYHWDYLQQNFSDLITEFPNFTPNRHLLFAVQHFPLACIISLWTWITEQNFSCLDTFIRVWEIHQLTSESLSNADFYVRWVKLKWGTSHAFKY